MKKKKKKKKKPRQVAAKKLLAIYGKLAPTKRDPLQEMLLQHAFLRGANSFYIDWAGWNECDRRSSYLGLLEHVSEDAAHAWFDWAVAISTESLSAKTVREVILDFVGELVSFRFCERFQS
jgi:hypothetical protein